MRAIDPLGGTEILSEEECWELLSSHHIGRVAVTIGGEVDIFPINYGLDGDGIVFRTNAGRKMSGAFTREVAFEIESIDLTTKTGWSVVVHGQARDITRFDGSQRRQAAQPCTGPKDFLIRLAARTVTGRRIAT